MSAAKFYDADQYLVSFAGAILQGFADGEFMTIEQASDAFDEVVGTDGEVARSKTNNRMVKVTIKLLQTSASNLFLSGIHQKDVLAPNGAGVNAFHAQDLQGNSVIHASQAWIKKMPDASLDRAAKSREWVIMCAVGERIEGGN